jgi:hypothetical protein
MGLAGRELAAWLDACRGCFYLNNPCSEVYFFEISSSEASILAHPSRCLAGVLAPTVGAFTSPRSALLAKSALADLSRDLPPACRETYQARASSCLALTPSSEKQCFLC